MRAWREGKLPMEPKLLALLLLASAAVWAFVNIADEVIEGDTHAFDEWVLLSLRVPGDVSDPIGPTWFEEFARDVTSLGGIGVLTLFVAIAAGWLFLAGRRWTGTAVVVANGLGLALNSVLKGFFDRPRPDLVPHEVMTHTASFPSGHAMLSAVTYLTLAALLSRVQPDQRLRAYVIGVAAALTVAIGASRVYLGVHYPSDVLAGWSAGAAWALLAWLALGWLERRYR